MRDTDTRQRFEKFACEMHRSSTPARGEIEFSRLRLCERDQLLDVLGWQRGGDDQHRRRGRDHPDRHRFAHVVAELRIKARIDAECDLTEQQGVAVRRRLGRKRVADVGSRTAAVIDDELNAQIFRELRRDHPGDGIAAAARGKRNDQRNRLCRVALRICHTAERCAARNQSCYDPVLNRPHDVVSLTSVFIQLNPSSVRPRGLYSQPTQPPYPNSSNRCSR